MKKLNFVYLLCISCSAIGFMSLTSCGAKKSYDINNFLENGTTENPYKIVKEPVTIKIFAPHSQGNPEYKDQKMFKYLEKITNLNFEFVTPDTSAYSSRRAAVWEDRNYKPDLFLFNNPISEQVQFQEKKFNAFVPFNDSTFKNDAGEIGNVIDKYMPNYKSGLDNNFNIPLTKGNARESATLSDGKMYCTLSVSDVPRDLTYKMFINEVWIKNCYTNYLSSYCKTNNIQKAEDIKTIENYLGVLRDFKTCDANNNGNNDDEVPVTSKSLEYLRNFILESYGAVSYGCEINADGSKFEYTPLTDAYKYYLEIANTMYTEGLMDASTFSIKTDNEMAKKGNNGLLGSFVAAAPYLITSQKEDIYNDDSSGKHYRLDKEYTTFGPLKSDKYTGELLHTGFDYFKPDGACIPQSSIYVREVARLLDIMYSELGTQLISYGVEGEDWDWDDDSKTSWTFKVPSTWTGSQEDYRATITPNVGSASALYWSNDFVGKMNDDVISSLNEQSNLYTPYLKVAEPSKYKFTNDEYDQISQIKAALDPKLEFLESSAIKGDITWDKFKNDLSGFVKTNIGGKEYSLEGIYNDMLKRY